MEGIIVKRSLKQSTGNGGLTKQQLGALQVRLNNKATGWNKCPETREGLGRALPMIEAAREGKEYDGQMYGVRTCGCQMSFDELWEDPAMVLTTCATHPETEKRLPGIMRGRSLTRFEGDQPRA